MEFCWEQAHETLDLLGSRKGKNGLGKKRKGTVGKDVARRNKIHKWPYTHTHGPYRLSALSIPYLKVQERRGLSEKDI